VTRSFRYDRDGIEKPRGGRGLAPAWRRHRTHQRLSLVRQHRRGQRHFVRARTGNHGPAWPEWRWQIDAPAHARWFPRALEGHRPDVWRTHVAEPRALPARRVGAGARGRLLVPDRLRFRAPQRPPAEAARPGG